LKLAISNIIWPKGKTHFPDFLDSARDAGVNGVELALNAIFEEPTTLPDDELIALRQEIVKRGLVVSALHSLTYTRGDLELFDGKEKRDELYSYLVEYIRIARLLNCSHLVFGSPSARKMRGQNKGECDDIFLEFLISMDKGLGDVSLNIEPLHPAMCEYLHRLDEARALITMGALRNVRIQLDLRACIESDESADEIRSSLPFVKHCQVSDPGLVPISGAYARKHEVFAALLRDSGYSGFIAGEMLSPQGWSGDKALREAVASMRRYYGG
jgi:sugar phosphate isomerase/epimerase